MVSSLSTLGSAALALALGLRHGLDADHLAAIDNMTRFNMIRKRAVAPYCGALFSAGHAATIVLTAVALMRFASGWTLPSWLESAGKASSAAVLLLLGCSNLLCAIKPDGAATRAHLVGVRSRLFAFVLRASGPWQILLVGVLFAVSFDALGLAILFAARSASLGGDLLAAMLALPFAVGMVAVDGANGAWLAGLVRRSDRASGAASHAMTLLIALMSLLVGAALATSCVWGSFDRWVGAHELRAGVLGIVAVLLAYVLGKPADPAQVMARSRVGISSPSGAVLQWAGGLSETNTRAAMITNTAAETESDGRRP